jgi:hypothetical protein
MKQLVAGPVFSEFGWELLAWQGLVRKMAVGYDKVIICAREGHEPLYKDFATTFIPHQIAGLKDCWSVTNVDLSAVKSVKNYCRSLQGDWIQPTGFVEIKAQKFIKYGSRERGKRLGYNFDIVCHARKPIGKRPSHSWNPWRWNELVQRLDARGLRVAAIGTEAYLPEGAVDMRAAPLTDVMDAMAAATMVVGPSSGPMHLASLCGAPHLVWTDQQYYSAIQATNRERYERVWNPLNTPCRVLDQDSWQPSVDAIYTAIEECLTTWTQKKSLPNSAR